MIEEALHPQEAGHCEILLEARRDFQGAAGGKEHDFMHPGFFWAADAVGHTQHTRLEIQAKKSGDVGMKRQLEAPESIMHSIRFVRGAVGFGNENCTFRNTKLKLPPLVASGNSRYGTFVVN